MQIRNRMWKHGTFTHRHMFLTRLGCCISVPEKQKTKQGLSNGLWKTYIVRGYSFVVSILKCTKPGTIWYWLVLIGTVWYYLGPIRDSLDRLKCTMSDQNCWGRTTNLGNIVRKGPTKVLQKSLKCPLVVRGLTRYNVKCDESVLSVWHWIPTPMCSSMMRRQRCWKQIKPEYPVGKLSEFTTILPILRRKTWEDTECFEKICAYLRNYEIVKSPVISGIWEDIRPFDGVMKRW